MTPLIDRFCGQVVVTDEFAGYSVLPYKKIDTKFGDELVTPAHSGCTGSMTNRATTAAMFQARPTITSLSLIHI